jgi:hypothetical protein
MLLITLGHWHSWISGRGWVMLFPGLQTTGAVRSEPRRAIFGPDPLRSDVTI